MTQKKTMTKAEELLAKISEAIRPFVYPYTGSDFMTGTESEGAKDVMCKGAIDAIRPLLNAETKLYDPKRNRPRQSPDDITFSETVFIIDEEGLHGLAYFSFKDDKWYFLTDTLVDYDEPGAETEWKWYYPEVKWGESTEDPDPSELLKEAVALLELWNEMVPEIKATGLNPLHAIIKTKQFLKKQ
jgi:hypothetical protein